MQNDLLTLIKKSGSIRKFKRKKITKELLNNVLEAGKWGLSVLGMQPWNIICIVNKVTKDNIADITLKKAKELPIGVNMIMKITASVIRSADILIGIYNNQKLQKRATKFGNKSVHRARIAELQVIGGVIQNMFLEANSLGLGAVWLDAPTFCEDDINNLLDEHNELIAFLALGYPDIEPKRSKRNVITRFIQ